MYRQYQHNDIIDLQRLMLQLGYSIQPEELQNNVRAIRNQGGEIFVYELRGTVSGCVCVLMDARLAEGVYAEIVSLVVCASTRGKGIGKGLVETAEEWAAGKVAKIRVRANTVREDAHLFYERLGYHNIKSQKVFIKNVEENITLPQ